jgi:acetyltransferase-like isoleucine patch superfamily enzyme
MKCLQRILSFIGSNTILMFLKITRSRNIRYCAQTRVSGKLNIVDLHGAYIYIANRVLLCNCSLRISNGGMIDIKQDSSLLSSDIQANGGKVQIGYGSYIGKEATIISTKCIEIGNNTAIGPHCMMFDHDHQFSRSGVQDWSKTISTPISIGDNVWIGANVTILRGTVIGNNSIIGAGTVVKGNIPECSLVHAPKAIISVLK